MRDGSVVCVCVCQCSSAVVCWVSVGLECGVDELGIEYEAQTGYGGRSDVRA